MKKLSKLLLSSFLMLSCFNISSVYAEGEETGDVTSEDQTGDSIDSNTGTSDNGTIGTNDGSTKGTDSPANESDISVLSDGPGEFEGVATITRDGVLNHFSTVADAVAYAVDGETITLTTDVSEFVTIEGKSITLDLGEHTISGLEGQEGTVITIKNATATVTNGTVTGGTKSGLIFEDSTITLSTLNVTNNKGGFQNHTIGNSGGGLFALNSDVTIKNSVFNNNTANTSQTEDGGAISFWGAKTLTISDCTFTNNTANGGGGAVFLKKGSKLYLSGSNFTSNTAQTAGAIQFGDKTVGVNIEKCDFSENKASGTAGALYVSTTADINVTNCTFDHNNAGTTAGAISVYGGKATITGTTITNNESATYGGAIYVFVGTVNIKDSSDISSNKSTYGGAIFAQTIKELTIVDSFISKNEAYYGGGLMPYQSDVKLHNSDVYENKATVAGGGFYVWNASSLTSTNSSIINNIANNFGGGIYSASNDNKISISSDTELVNNTVPKENYGGSDYCGFGELTISKVNPELVLSETKHKIDGWYYDGYYVDDETSENNRWSLDDDDEYVREFDLDDEDTITYKGSDLLTLRAAHAHYRGYTVKYLDADSGEAIADELSFEDIKVGNTVKATAIDVDGYEFTNAVVGSETEVSSKDAELVIDKDEEKNMITFLYKALRNYTVNYVDEDTNTPISDSKTVENIKVGTEVSENAVDVDGYVLDGESVSKLVVDKDDTKNVVTFLYKALRGYTVNYIDTDTSAPISDSKVVENIKVGAEISENAIDVDGYTLEGDSTSGLVVDRDATKNVITFSYKALRSYTVNYVDKDTNTSISDSKRVENVKVGTEVSENAIDVDGYTLDGDSTSNLVVDRDETNNVITFYYTVNKTVDPTPTPTTPTDDDNTPSPTPTPAADNTTPVAPVVPATTPTRRTTPARRTTPVAPDTDTTPTATPEATVEPTATPEATATPEVIDDDATPEVAAKGNWALINLIAAMVSVLLGVIALIAKHKDEEENDEEDSEEDENTSKRHRTWKIVSAIDAIVAVVAFILTEDITQKMVMVDKWTILMVVLAVVSVVSVYFARKWHEEDEETSEDAQ